MSADLNLICGLSEAAAASQKKNTSVDDPVNAEADQVGELKGDRVESESKTGVSDDNINKEENIQAVEEEEEREEKLVEILEDRDVQGNKKELINHDELSNAVAEAQESRDTSVDVAESELNRSSNDEEMVEEESKFNSSIDMEEHEDSQAVVISCVHNDLDLDQQRDPVELNNTEDVPESEPNQSRNDDEKVEESKLDLKDSQTVVSNGLHNGLDLDQEKTLKELMNDDDVTESKPNHSRNDGEKVESEEKTKVDSAIHVEENKDSQPVVINGVHNNLDLNQEKEPSELTNGVHNNLDLNQEKEPSELTNDVPLEDSGEASRDSFNQNLETAPCPVVADEKREAESAVGLVSDGNRDGLLAGHAQDLAETQVVDSHEASGDSFNQNSETAPCPVVTDEKREAESAAGLVSDGNRDGLLAGHAQDTVAETQVVDSLVDAKQNMSESSFEKVELLATSDAETGKSFPIASDNGTLGDATNHILADTVQSEVLVANGLDIHEKVSLLASQESASQTVLVNDFVHASQMTPEHNHIFEISMKVSSHEAAPVKSCESFPISPSNGDMVEEPAVGIKDSCPMEDTKLCDIVRIEVDHVHADGGSADSHSVDVVKVESEVENVNVLGYTAPSCSTEPEEAMTKGSSRVNTGGKTYSTVLNGYGLASVSVIGAFDEHAAEVGKAPYESKVNHAKFQVEKKSIQPRIQMKKVGEQKNQTRQSKHATLENGSPTLSVRYQNEEPRKEKNKRTKGEVELARKSEELRKEKEAATLKKQQRLEEKAKAKEAIERKKRMADMALYQKADELRKEKEAAMLKEQRRLEEKAKAKEAMERKKRMADRAQVKAALRAEREAEQKEKEREKKARKKEKKKAAAENTKDIDEIETDPSSETPKDINESERTEKSVTKRPRKPSQFAKQTKAKSMPLPLRNRGKRKRKTWMWALLSLLVVIALFFTGNSSFLNFGPQRSGI